MSKKEILNKLREIAKRHEDEGFHILADLDALNEVGKKHILPTVIYV